MKSLNTALALYQLNWSAFPAAIGSLGGTTSPATALGALVLDDTISKDVAAGPYNGYVWTYTQGVGGASFTLTAAPAASNQAVRNYYLDQGGTIKYADSAAATAISPALGN